MGYEIQKFRKIATTATNVFYYKRLLLPDYRYFILNWKSCCYESIFSKLRPKRSIFANKTTNYGLSMKPPFFIHHNAKLLGLGRQFRQINFGVFAADLSASILIATDKGRLKFLLCRKENSKVQKFPEFILD